MSRLQVNVTKDIDDDGNLIISIDLGSIYIAELSELARISREKAYHHFMWIVEMGRSLGETTGAERHIRSLSIEKITPPWQGIPRWRATAHFTITREEYNDLRANRIRRRRIAEGKDPKPSRLTVAD